MAKYKTAQGKIIDMGMLAAKNEHVRAVGNLKVNARGDTIDSNGTVIKSANTKINEHYSKTVGNRSAMPIKQKPIREMNDPVQIDQTKNSVPDSELTLEEQNLNNDLEDDIEVEKIKKEEGRKGNTKYGK